ncbi:hypothetical protein BJ508DRAFT_347813 [Ascobolus immersus RN42]|uniref:Uncharacterized protein n=1 Tax=Ascobolus immersus RN42 TaxID=1160509 RepID=A0A3N4I1F1_ASCIM|nr:hypothetical protein BJ508DRAFT_347813 [Ascobolus immersus RN42]
MMKSLTFTLLTLFFLSHVSAQRWLQPIIGAPGTSRVWFYPHANCIGPGIGCPEVKNGKCCSVGRPNASLHFAPHGRTFLDKLKRMKGCSRMNCEGPCVEGLSPITCHNGPYAVYSVVISTLGLLGGDNNEADRIDGEPSGGSQDCEMVSAVKWLDADGNEVIAKIPEGKLDEVIDATEKNDMNKLMELLDKK